eukprot:Gb_22727 [translate_table: standard]
MVSGVVGVLSVAAMATETEKVENVMPEKKPATKGKTTKEKKAKGTMKKKKIKAPMNHPPYRQMITEAIFGSKERIGSSQQAISKFIEEKYKADLPPNFRRLLLTQLKNLTKAPWTWEEDFGLCMGSTYNDGNSKLCRFIRFPTAPSSLSF